MGRKKKEKSITVGISDLIYQPHKMSRLPALDSRVASRTILAILQRLQGLFALARAQERDPQLYLKFETDQFEVKKSATSSFERGDVLFNLSLSDIAEPNHYPEVRAALKGLEHVKVLVPVKEEPGKYRTSSLMDIKGEYDADGNLIGTNFSVIVPRITAENILDINLLGGFSRFLLFTASQFRSDYGYTLYIRLSDEWRRYGDVFEIGYEDLRQNMGFVLEKEEYKDKDGKVKERIIDHTKKHASWSLFCRYVLNQAQEELQMMADRQPPVTDFTFSYEGLLNGQPLPKYKRPDAIRFTIHPTAVGRKLAADTAFSAQSIQARRMMTDIFGLTEGQARTFMRRVTPDNVGDLLRVMQQLQSDLDAGRRKANNRTAVAVDEIKKFLNKQKEDAIIEAEEVPTTPNTQSNPTISPTTPSPAPDGTPAGEAVASPDPRWQQFIDQVLADCPTANDRAMLGPFLREGVRQAVFADGTLALTVATRASYDWFRGSYGSFFAQEREKYLPGIEIKFFLD